ncbi:MAG: LacI family DNA-binding transcriptional regulator [Clostridia bacterium]|nr:LacI family DNA-binding transcriptional regulator [Clostridia bacterium]
MEKQATIVDVAELAQVSVATVSRALSGGSASPATRKKVEEAVRALGYQAPARGKPAREKLPGLALVTSDLSNPYYAALCSGAAETARQEGYALTVYQKALSERTDQTIVDQILRLPVAGAVLVGSVVESGTEEEIQQRLSAIEQAMPIVTIGPRVEGVHCVNITSDLSLSVRKSITHLYALGHRRISFIGGSGGVRSSSARRRAYYREMERLGLPADRESVVDAGFTPQTGEACVNRLLGALPRETWPTAMIAINDLVALGALRQLQRMGIRVPEDVALIGCDNQFFTPFLTPPLTTVDLHPFDHGAVAVRELINAMEGGGHAFSQIRECSLIVRESCGSLLGIRPELGEQKTSR